MEVVEVEFVLRKRLFKRVDINGFLLLVINFLFNFVNLFGLWMLFIWLVWMGIFKGKLKRLGIGVGWF